MLTVLRAYFERNGPVTDEQFDLRQSKFISRQLKRGEFLLREGEIARYAAFVAKGCLRSLRMCLATIACPDTIP